MSSCVYTSSVFVIKPLNAPIRFAFLLFGQVVSVWRIPVTSIIGGSHGRSVHHLKSNDNYLQTWQWRIISFCGLIKVSLSSKNCTNASVLFFDFWTGCFRVTDTSYKYNNRWVTRSYTILKATTIIHRLVNYKSCILLFIPVVPLSSNHWTHPSIFIFDFFGQVISVS